MNFHVLFVADSKHFQNGLKEELLNRYIYSSRNDIKLGKINIYCIPQLIHVITLKNINTGWETGQASKHEDKMDW